MAKSAEIGKHELILKQDYYGPEKADYSVLDIIGAEIVTPVLDEAIVEVLGNDHFVAPVPDPLEIVTQIGVNFKEATLLDLQHPLAAGQVIGADHFVDPALDVDSLSVDHHEG